MYNKIGFLLTCHLNRNTISNLTSRKNNLKINTKQIFTNKYSKLSLNS